MDTPRQPGLISSSDGPDQDRTSAQAHLEATTPNIKRSQPGDRDSVLNAAYLVREPPAERHFESAEACEISGPLSSGAAVRSSGTTRAEIHNESEDRERRSLQGDFSDHGAENRVNGSDLRNTPEYLSLKKELQSKVGNILKIARLSARLSLGKASEVSDIDPFTIKALEQGQAHQALCVIAGLLDHYGADDFALQDLFNNVMIDKSRREIIAEKRRNFAIVGQNEKPWEKLPSSLNEMRRETSKAERADKILDV